MSSRIHDLNGSNIATGVVSALLAITGAPAIILQGASNGNFTTEQTILWMFSVYFFGGLFSILIPLYYKMPITGAHSITGVAFLATVTSQFTFQELLGAYFISGLIMLLIGYYGVFSKLLNYVPKELIAVMLAGMITKYITQFVLGVYDLPFIGGVAMLVFLMLTKWHTRIPAMVGAILTGVIILLITEDLTFQTSNIPFIVPKILIPEFNPVSILGVSVPLALLILSNDAAVGLGALEQKEYCPPVNKIITLSGLFSMITSIFGGQSANVAGMMSAICSGDEAGQKEKRYMASVVSGIIVLMFGIFAWRLVPVIQILPKAFIAILVGFSLLGVFSNNLQLGFSNPKMKLSAALTFVIALSNISIFNIGAPVWSLLIGTLVARTIERS